LPILGVHFVVHFVVVIPPQAIQLSGG